MSENADCWPHMECACDDDGARRSRSIWRRLFRYLDAARYDVRPRPAIVRGGARLGVGSGAEPDAHVFGRRVDLTS